MANNDNEEFCTEEDIEKRTLDLIEEFEEHFSAIKEIEETANERRDEVFQAWAMQKIAGLQLCVEEIVNKFNAHVTSRVDSN